MTGCTVKELCAAVGGTLLQQSGAVVTQVSTDSRSIPNRALFVPLVGERFDGHDYLDAALERGAAGCLTARKPASLLPDKFYIQVSDTLEALKALAAWYRAKFDIPMVQVTGSAGKTTTKEMIAAVLSQRFSTLKTQANFNNAIGTPMTLLNLAPEHQAAVIETGMNHFGEIRYLGEMVRPTVAVITNVGDAHIENLGGTRQGILQAKCEIFENLQPGGLAVLNGDDELLSGLTLPFETVLCGRHERCGVRVTNVAEHGIEGVTCTVTTKREVYEVAIPSPGAYMIYPAAMAIAIGEHLGLTKAELLSGMSIRTPEDAAQAARRLLDTGLSTVYISLGAEGIYAADRQGSTAWVPCARCHVANATGGGDAVAAALAARMVLGDSLADTARWAVGAGALACEAETTINPAMCWDNIETILNRR